MALPASRPVAAVSGEATAPRAPAAAHQSAAAADLAVELLLPAVEVDVLLAVQGPVELLHQPLELLARLDPFGHHPEAEARAEGGGGAAPDLRASPAVLDRALFERIVRDGLNTGKGMPAYADLTDRELESLRHYIRQQAEAGLAAKD